MTSRSSVCVVVDDCGWGGGIMALRLCWVCWLYFGISVGRKSVRECACERSVGSDRVFHSQCFVVTCTLRPWRHLSDGPGVYGWCRLYLLTILSRLRKTGRKDGAFRCCSVAAVWHRYAPVTWANKLASCLHVPWGRKDDRLWSPKRL